MASSTCQAARCGRARATLASQQQLTRELRDQLSRRLAKLEARERRLIDLATDGLLSRSKILERSNAIQLERVRIQASLADTSTELEVGAARLRQCLELVTNPVRLCGKAPGGTRKQLNATFYQRFYLDDEPVAIVRDERKPPFDEIHEAMRLLPFAAAGRSQRAGSRIGIGP